MIRMWAFVAAVARNVRMALRRPDLIVQTIAVPLVVLGLASVIFGATDAWPIAVIDDDRSAASAQFRRALDDTEGVSGDYFRVITTDSQHAADMVEDGRLQLVVRIPDGFADRRQIEIATYNINTDAMKNVRLRVSQTSNLFDAVTGYPQVTGELHLAEPESVSRTAFMGGSAIVLALLLGSVLIAANLFAAEQEMRTTKELILTPLSPALGTIGAATAAVLLAAATALPTAGMALLFGFRADPAQLGAAATLVVPAMITAAGTGVLLAQLLRTHRAVQPVIILGALASYFATGGFIPVAGLPPAARAFSAVWPPSYVFEWANPVLHGFRGSADLGSYGILCIAVVLGAGAAIWAAQREQFRPTTGGQ